MSPGLSVMASGYLREADYASGNLAAMRGRQPVCMLRAIRNPTTSAPGPGCGKKGNQVLRPITRTTEKTHGRNRQHFHEQRAPPRDHQGGAQGHFRVSLGTVFEWYDFYLYGSLAAIIAKHFFSGVNETRPSSSP